MIQSKSVPKVNMRRAGRVSDPWWLTASFSLVLLGTFVTESGAQQLRLPQIVVLKHEKTLEPRLHARPVQGRLLQNDPGDTGRRRENGGNV